MSLLTDFPECCVDEFYTLIFAWYGSRSVLVVESPKMLVAAEDAKNGGSALTSSSPKAEHDLLVT
jgi:hypothetical protein